MAGGPQTRVFFVTTSFGQEKKSPHKRRKLTVDVSS